MSNKKTFGASNVLAAFQGNKALRTAAPHGLQYSEVQYIPPKQLSVNLLNEKLFPEEDSERFTKLADDIRERGIATPLIAKRDGTLLAGHNRLRIALMLNLQSIPVRYLESELSHHEEMVYVIKDNILRRQFRNEDYVRFYKMMYPDFEARLVTDARSKAVQEVEMKGYKPITFKSIADDTGQNQETVRKQLQRETKRNHASQAAIAQSSIETSMERVKARQREFSRVMKSYSEEILAKVQFYSDVLDKDSRAKLAKGLRDVAKEIERM